MFRKIDKRLVVEWKRDKETGRKSPIVRDRKKVPSSNRFISKWRMDKCTCQCTLKRNVLGRLEMFWGHKYMESVYTQGKCFRIIPRIYDVGVYAGEMFHKYMADVGAI